MKAFKTNTSVSRYFTLQRCKKEGEEDDEEEEEPEWKGPTECMQDWKSLLSALLCKLFQSYANSREGLTEKTLCAENERITAESFGAWKALDYLRFGI